jgi:putative MATE family efflux protein
MIYANAHRASGNTRLPMVAIASSLVIKLGLNYLFIYGNLGFPALGIRGAALATLLAKLIELFLLLFFTYRHETPVSAPLHELFDFDRTLTLKAARSILPVIVNEGLWGLGTNVYSAIYATISTTSIAAVSAVSPIDTLMFTLFFSLGDSCGILIGNHLGRGERQIPYNYARRTVMLSGSLGALTGLIVFLFRDPILGLYTLSPEAHEYARGLLTILCASLPIRTIAYAMMIGTLRSGGDIRYCMVVDLTTIWLVGIPVSLILARVFHFPITIVYFGYVLDELVKVIVVSRRIRSKKWMHTLTTSS